MSDFVGFEYNGLNTELLDLVISKASAENNSGISREILKGDVTQYRTEALHYGMKYSDVLTLNFGLVKNPCMLNYDPGFTEEELRWVYNWLTSSSVPMPLVTDKSDIEYHGVFTDINPIYAGAKIVGIDTVFKCSSPFGIRSYMKEVFYKEEEGLTRLLSILPDTDCSDEYIYPIITINTYALQGGEIIIKNDKESGKQIKLNVEANTCYTIDCENKIILKSNSTTTTATPVSLSDLGYSIESVFDYNGVNTGTVSIYWMKLHPKTTNKITFTGKAYFVLNYKEKLKVGGLYV